MDQRSPDLTPHLFEPFQDIILLLGILLLCHVILMKMWCLIVKLRVSKTGIIILSSYLDSKMVMAEVISLWRAECKKSSEDSAS